MNNENRYLWEITQYENLTGNKTLLKISNKCSFYEVVNKKEIDISLRFSEEFKNYIGYKLLNEKEETKENFEYIENELLKFLGKLDLIRGLNKKKFVKELIWKEISNFIDVSIFNENEKNIITLYYYRMKKSGNDFKIFLEVIKNIFKNILVFYTKKEILLYTSSTKEEKNIKKMQIIIDVFLDIDFPIRIFWENPCGIIGVSQTLKIDSIEIY